MRPSFKVLTAIYASHPASRAFQRQHGITATQLAAELTTLLDSAPNAQARDQFFSKCMAAVGIFTPGVAQFNAGTEQMLAQMTTPDAIETHAARMSEESRRTPQYVSPERIKFLHGVAKGSALQQGLADRFRANDRRAAEHENPAIPQNANAQRQGEDQRDRRSALLAAMSQADSTDYVRLDREYDNVRDTLRAAFDVHENIADMADPLADERLLSMSDSV
ncbi:hypothetical protein ACVNIS_06435 [Sphaerotilaceae bacterium SBD11-9]